jgi:tight adherence protein B
MILLIRALLVLGILAAIATGLILTLLQVRRTRREWERHLALVIGNGDASPINETAEEHARAAKDRRAAFERRLRGIFTPGMGRNWGMTAGVPKIIIAAMVAGLVAWMALRVGLHLASWMALAAAAAAAYMGPRILLKRQQGRADKKFMEVFPDCIGMVIRMLRAGLPIAGAVRAVGNEAPPPVSDVFTSLADQMAIGIAFEDALSAAGNRIGLKDFQFFAVAVALQRATGGNLATTLDILSDLMRKRRATRLKAQATTGEVRMSAYVLGAIPFVVIGGLLIMTPGYLQPLLNDPRGRIIIAGAVTSMLIGFGIIRTMMRSVTNAG